MKNSNLIKADSLGHAWLKSMAIVLSRGDQHIPDEVDTLSEVRNLYVEIKSVNQEDPILQEYADKDRIALMKEKYQSCDIIANYRISYGKLLYDNQGVNQIEWVINKLSVKPETKSATIGLHHPGDDILSCVSLIDFKLRDGNLSMTAVYRSQNIYASQPGNVLSLRDVQQYVASKLGANIGEFNLVILSAIIYDRDQPKVENILKSTM
jgi:thymidylate synthase